MQLIDKFDRDDEFKKLLKDLCFEIDKLDTDFLKTVAFLAKIPYELAMLVVENLKYDKDDYLGVLNTLYYDEFINGVNKKDSKNNTIFENRILSRESTNYENFLVDRFLTLKEIENLIQYLIKDEKLNSTLLDVLEEKKELKSKNIKILLKTHKVLSKKQNVKVYDETMEKLGKVWLKLTLENIIDLKRQKLNAK